MSLATSGIARHPAVEAGLTVSANARYDQIVLGNREDPGLDDYGARIPQRRGLQELACDGYMAGVSARRLGNDKVGGNPEGSLRPPAADWRKRQQSRAQVLVVNEGVTHKGLPPKFTPDLCWSRAARLAKFSSMCTTRTLGRAGR